MDFLAEAVSLKLTDRTDKIHWKKIRALNVALWLLTNNTEDDCIAWLNTLQEGGVNLNTLLTHATATIADATKTTVPKRFDVVNRIYVCVLKFKATKSEKTTEKKAAVTSEPRSHFLKGMLEDEDACKKWLHMLMYLQNIKASTCTSTSTTKRDIHTPVTKKKRLLHKKQSTRENPPTPAPTPTPTPTPPTPDKKRRRLFS